MVLTGVNVRRSGHEMGGQLKLSDECSRHLPIGREDRVLHP